MKNINNVYIINTLLCEDKSGSLYSGYL